MADATVLSTVISYDVWVQVPPGLQVMGSGFLITTHIYYGSYVLFII